VMRKSKGFAASTGGGRIRKEEIGTERFSQT